MESFKNHLQNFPQFRPELFEQARPYLSKVNLNNGDIFLPHGRVCKQIAFVKKGLMRLYYLNDGKEITHCFCRENTITTSYRSLVTQESSEIAMQAIEPTELIVLSYADLQKLYEQDLFWQQLGRLAVENEFMSAETHHKMLRDLPAKDRYLEILTNDQELLQRVPLNHLATYLQITPETLSRIRNKISRN